jgi:hypothetical protein
LDSSEAGKATEDPDQKTGNKLKGETRVPFHLSEESKEPPMA